MNRFLGDRFQDINDAIVSAPRASLLEMEQELSASLVQVKARLASAKNSKSIQPVLTGISGHVESIGRS